MLAVSTPSCLPLPSNDSAKSARLAIATMSARAVCSGLPLRSSSPVSMISTLAWSSTPTLLSARNASIMMTSPPFMSFTPWPRTRSPWRSHSGTELPLSNTVSRCPSSNTRLPGPPSCVATRCPARFMAGGMSIQRVLKPSASSSAR